MKESKITTEIKNSIIKQGGFAFKIPDSLANPKARFSAEKGVDLVGAFDGIFLAIEVKQIPRSKSIGHKVIRDSQKKFLDVLVQTNTRAFVFINIRRAAQQVEGALDRENTLVIFDWELWADHFKGPGIPRDVLAKYAARTGIKGKGGQFDLSRFFACIKNNEPFI